MLDGLPAHDGRDQQLVSLAVTRATASGRPASIGREVEATLMPLGVHEFANQRHAGGNGVGAAEGDFPLMPLRHFGQLRGALRVHPCRFEAEAA